MSVSPRSVRWVVGDVAGCEEAAIVLVAGAGRVVWRLWVVGFIHYEILTRVFIT